MTDILDLSDETDCARYRRALVEVRDRHVKALPGEKVLRCLLCGNTDGEHDVAFNPLRWYWPYPANGRNLMSCSLYWKPASRDGKGGYKGTLRDSLIKRYGDNGRLDIDALPFLEGLVAAGIQEAQELIDAIEKHETIEIWQEC